MTVTYMYEGVLIEDDAVEMPLEQPTEAVLEYRRFMADSANAYNCERCPENQGMASLPWEDRHPCGQYRCWVTCH